MAINFVLRRAQGGGREVRRRTSARTRSAPAPSRSTEWTLGQRLVLERNPDYYKAGLPKLDRITFEVGQEPLVALLRLQRGEVDILGDGIPPAKFLEVRNNPECADNVDRGRPAAHRLRDDERQHAAVRQAAGAAGGQPRDQQGPHRPDHQRPRGAGQPAPAAGDAGLRQGLSRATPTIRTRPRRCWPRRPASATASRPSSTR